MPSIFQNKKIRSLAVFSGLVLVIVGIGLIWPQGAALADDGMNFIESAISWILMRIVGFLANLLVQIINILVAVAKYNDFINATAVVKGWVIVRDVCNMLFIAILLVIAFGTIFKWEAYRYTRLLPKFILMAVLINFSKFICGFFIDFFQVLMMTFVNAFAGVAAGNFINGLHLREMVSFREDAGTDVSLSGVFGALLLAVTLLLIAVVVMLVITIFLLFRIMMLWILVVLSPLAFVLRAWPGKGERYASEWWDQFTNNLTSGPILAFFIWLSLSVMTLSSGDPETTCQGTNPNVAGIPCVDTTEQTASTTAPTTGVSGKVASTISAISESDTLLSYIISIAMLMGSLMMAQKMGGMGGQLAGQALGGVQKRLSTALKYGAAGAAGGALGVALWKGRGVISKAPGWARRKVTGGIVSTAASSKVLQGAMGYATRAPIIGALAGQGLSRMQRRQKADKAKAEEYVNSFDQNTKAGARALTNMANAPLIGRLTDSRRKIRSAARNIMPTSIRDPRRRQEQINRMDVKAIGALSIREQQNLGREHSLGNIDLFQNQDLIDYAQRNQNFRGNLSRGSVRDVVDRRGTPVPGIVNPATGEALLGLATGGVPFGWGRGSVGPGTNLPPLRRLASWWERNKSQGDGDWSLNALNRGQKNEIGLDFSKFGDKFQQRLLEGSGRRDVKHIKGADLTRGDINRAATELVPILDKEIARLKEEGGSQEEIDEAQKTRDIFANPEAVKNMDHLDLINTSAVNYKRGQLRITKPHEEIHGEGVTDEKSVDQIVKILAENKMRSLAPVMARYVRSGLSPKQAAKELQPVMDKINSERAKSNRGEKGMRPEEVIEEMTGFKTGYLKERIIRPERQKSPEEIAQIEAEDKAQKEAAAAEDKAQKEAVIKEEEAKRKSAAFAEELGVKPGIISEEERQPSRYSQTIGPGTAKLEREMAEEARRKVQEAAVRFGVKPESLGEETAAPKYSKTYGPAAEKMEREIAEEQARKREEKFGRAVKPAPKPTAQKAEKKSTILYSASGAPINPEEYSPAAEQEEKAVSEEKPAVSVGQPAPSATVVPPELKQNAGLNSQLDKLGSFLEQMEGNLKPDYEKLSSALEKLRQEINKSKTSSAANISKNMVDPLLRATSLGPNLTASEFVRLSDNLKRLVEVFNKKSVPEASKGEKPAKKIGREEEKTGNETVGFEERTSKNPLSSRADDNKDNY
ncbi:MAG: hypothetical protein WC528_00995 [Patescibacteria group bacterium]